MIPTFDMRCAAFSGLRLIAEGQPHDVLPAVKAAADAGEGVLVFDLATGHAVEFDLRGDLETALARLPVIAPESKKGPGRPRLGVKPREVTLLPRHWDWLASQPGGASAALRRMVEAAMREAEGPDRARRSREAAYRFMTALAGDLPNYEEATRTLFAGDSQAFEAAVAAWPQGVRDTVRTVAKHAWAAITDKGLFLTT
nr:DUF2239 family protein [uncultured Brevundimonas sp.]